MAETRFELPDTHGLISGVVFRPEERPLAVGWPEILQLREVADGGIAWLHFNLTDIRACDWISHSGSLPEEAAQSLLASDTRIRLDRVGQGITGVLGDLHHDFDLDPEGLGLVRFY